MWHCKQSTSHRSSETSEMELSSALGAFKSTTHLPIMVLLFTLAVLKGSMAAPTTVVAQPTGPEFWASPCGIPPEATSTVYPDSKYAEQYARQNGLALSYLNNWIERFCQHAQRTTCASWIVLDAQVRYDWLNGKAIPKTPGQHLGSSHYQTKQFTEMLTFSSDMFQRLSVGLEQIDVEKLDVDFKADFADTVLRIKQVLCVLETILVDKRMARAPNPTRAIMPSELRNLQLESDRDVRTFRVLKEYLNALEYFQDGFNHFASSLKSAL